METKNLGGRPKKADAYARMRFFQKNISDDELKSMLDVQLARAQAGDSKACELILDGYFGKQTTPFSLGLEEEIISLVRELGGFGVETAGDVSEGE